jgi:hypothetical protein
MHRPNIFDDIGYRHLVDVKQLKGESEVKKWTTQRHMII